MAGPASANRPTTGRTLAAKSAHRIRMASVCVPPLNTTSGSVHDAYDALSSTDLAIVGEEVLRIEMCLVGIADVPLACFFHFLPPSTVLKSVPPDPTAQPAFASLN